jgi:hypothetical protein
VESFIVVWIAFVTGAAGILLVFDAVRVALR